MDYQLRMISLTIVALACLAAAPPKSVSAKPQVVRLSEPVERTAEFETFGAPLDETLPSIELSSLVESGDRFVGESVLVTARVARVCQKKGCFFIAQQGRETLRVPFKDYGFFVPTDISGRRVTMAAELVRRELSQEEARHLSADLGADGAVEPGTLYELVATSVRVPRG